MAVYFGTIYFLSFFFVVLVISFIVIGVLRMFRSGSQKDVSHNDLSISTPSESSLPEKKIWKWYLVLVIIYYSLILIIEFLAQYEVINTLGASMDSLWTILSLWPLFNIVIFVLILKNNIEKMALLLPILALPQLMAYSGFFSLLDAFSLGFAIYLISRKQLPTSE